MTNDSEKSDLCEVATKPANKAAYAAAESAERRRRAKGNTIFYAEAAHVAANLINNTAEELDSVHLR